MKLPSREGWFSFILGMNIGAVIWYFIMFARGGYKWYDDYYYVGINILAIIVELISFNNYRKR